jgi:hypothetical protein
MAVRQTTAKNTETDVSMRDDNTRMQGTFPVWNPALPSTDSTRDQNQTEQGRRETTVLVAFPRSRKTGSIRMFKVLAFLGLIGNRPSFPFAATSHQDVGSRDRCETPTPSSLLVQVKATVL